MSRNLLPILEFRDQKLDLDKYEKELGFTFPPIYKAFLSNFKPEPKKQYAYLKRTGNEKNFINDDFRLISSLSYSSSGKSPIALEDDELGFIAFKSIESLLEFCVPEEEGMEDMIYISDHGSSDVLLLGIGNHNQDKIFLYSEIDNDWITYFSKNVFDFLFKCQIVESHFDRHYYGHIREIESDRLYKNWGEDFWRMREEPS